jgi:hypothetical protein
VGFSHSELCLARDWPDAGDGPRRRGAEVLDFLLNVVTSAWFWGFMLIGLGLFGAVILALGGALTNNTG